MSNTCIYVCKYIHIFYIPTQPFERLISPITKHDFNLHIASSFSPIFLFFFFYQLTKERTKIGESGPIGS